MATLPDPRPSLEGDDLAIYEAMLAEREARGGTLPGPYVPLAHHPHLARRLEAVGRLLRFEGALPRDVYEFAVLSVAVDVRVRYIWDDHVEAARQAGVPESVLDALERGGADMPHPYAMVREALHAFEQYRSLPQALQDAVTAEVGGKGLIELVTIRGFYALLGQVVRGFDIAAHPRGRPPVDPSRWSPGESGRELEPHA